MWPSIARTGRRLLRVGPPATPSGEPPPEEPSATPVRQDRSAAPVDAETRQAPIDDLVLTIGRPELDRLGSALQALLGPDTARPDTPARLEAALAAAVERLGGEGRPRVTRRPPGLYTPEA